MAWRIHESVIRGEVDNREKGFVRGKIWLHGRSEPIRLELRGNAHADLAGCLLKFVNSLPTEAHPHLDGLRPLQSGSIGDLTASRKVRVFDVPLEEALAMIRRKEKPPEHLANCLYLEWYSEGNGRVVVESTDYRLEISAPEWRLTPADEERRAQEASAGFTGFVERLSEAVVEQQGQGKEDIEDWDEFDFEQSMRESDAMTDKYLELLDKYGDDPEKEELIAKEMGWLDEDDGHDVPTGGEGDFDVEEINRICQEAAEEPLEPDPLTEGVDWIRVTRRGRSDIRHPLQHRCYEAMTALWQQYREKALEDTGDSSLRQLLDEFQITAAKLAGALNTLAYGRDITPGPAIVARLKRALDHLHKAQAGLEDVTRRGLLPEDVTSRTRGEMFEIRESILRLMEDFRRKT